MKRYMAWILALTCIFPLAGCATDTVDTPTTVIEEVPDSYDEVLLEPDLEELPEVVNPIPVEEIPIDTTAHVTEEEAPVDDSRLLTEDELAYFNTEYFNGASGENRNLANQFLHNPFTTPADIDLYMLFYLGAGDEYAMSEDGEYDAVARVYGFDGWQEIPTDVTPIPAASMVYLLETYTGTTLADSNQIGLDSFRYLEEYDCYYNLHGDTNYYGPVEFTGGTVQGDIVYLWYHNSWQDADYALTMTTSAETYWIVSNLPLVVEE